MDSIIFSGRVFPLFKKLTMGHKAVKITPIPSLSLRRAKFCLSIMDAIVTVDCEMEAITKSDASHLYKEAFVFAQTHIDVVAFHQAIGFHLILNEMTFQGITEELHLVCASQDTCTAYDLESSETILDILMADANLAIAFHDLVSSIYTPNLSTINCARAIDGLRQVISNYDRDVAKGWRKLRSALNVDEAYVRLITDNSAQPRHGHHVYQDAALTKEIQNRSWMLMNRSLLYVMRVREPLLPPEFELLKG